MLTMALNTNHTLSLQLVLEKKNLSRTNFWTSTKIRDFFSNTKRSTMSLRKLSMKALLLPQQQS